MHVALEISPLFNKRPSGIGRYGAQLLDGLHQLSASEDLQLTRLFHSERLRKLKRLPPKPGLPRRFWNDRWWRASGYDVVHATGHWFPAQTRVAKVVTIHDLYVLKGEAFASPAEIERQRGHHAHVAKHADHIVCVSDCTRRDVLEHFPAFDPAHIHVVHLGVDPRFTPQSDEAIEAARLRYAGGEPYLLFIGSFKPNKNIQRLLEAYATSPLRHDYKLMVAGKLQDGGEEWLAQAAQQFGMAGRICTPNYVPDADVPALYGAAAALAFPSLYEGFGLPILEAFASGTPVLTSTEGSCPEVAAGQAVLVDPYSVDALRAGLDEAVRRTPQQRESARAYAATKTWAETARQTLAVYRQAVR